MPEPVRVRLMIAWCATATQEGDLVLVRPMLDDGLAAARELGDDWATAWALIVRIMVARALSDPSTIAQVLADCDEGVQRSRAADDVVLEIRHTYLRGGVLALDGQLTEADETARRALHMARAARSIREVAWATWVLAICRYKRGDLTVACTLFMDCRREWQAEREPSLELLGLIGQVLVETDRGARTPSVRGAAGVTGALAIDWPCSGFRCNGRPQCPALLDELLHTGTHDKVATWKDAYSTVVAP